MPICAIYARVSDEMQAKGESVAHQVSFLREFARRKAHRGEEEWVIPEAYVFCDEGISGTTMIKRPAVMSLLTRAREGRFSVVLFKGISRFARDTVDALVMLRTLQAYGLRVISFEENYDSDKDSAELIFTMHSAVAQYESEKIGIRVRVGNFEKARSGKWTGRVPDGYRLNPTTKTLLPDPARAEVIRRIFFYAQKGLGGYRIAERLNEEQVLTSTGKQWTALKVQRVIQNPVYAGDVFYGRRMKKLIPPHPDDPLSRHYQVVWNLDVDAVARAQDAHPALISREVFLEATQHFETHGQRGRIGKGRCLDGLVVCSCGMKMKVKANGKGTEYYACPSKKYRGSACGQPYLRVEAVEEAVREAVNGDVRKAAVALDTEDQVFLEGLLKSNGHGGDWLTPEFVRHFVRKVWVLHVAMPYSLAIEYHWR